MKMVKIFILHLIFPPPAAGVGPEDHVPDGGEEGTGAEAGRGEEARRGDQLPEEDKPAAQVTAGGHHIAEEIKTMYII